jgi:hypothetical protein
VHRADDLWLPSGTKPLNAALEAHVLQHRLSETLGRLWGTPQHQRDAVSTSWAVKYRIHSNRDFRPSLGRLSEAGRRGETFGCDLITPPERYSAVKLLRRR